MRAFLQRWERPDSAVLGIVGDFQPAQVRCAVLRCAALGIMDRCAALC